MSDSDLNLVDPSARSDEDFDESNTLTMIDVLKEEKELEEDCNAVLGASDDQNCTYNKGYIRQALYACKTCTKSRAAICLACSLHCHEGHELIELYTKRLVKCDCGNPLFGDKKCKLDIFRKELNAENKYNHNYEGLYCICKRPYPDEADPNPDDMIQCCICEDWYHSKHLGLKTIPEGDDYSEMTCASCMKSHDFLWKYASILSVLKKKETETKVDEHIDVEEIKTECSLPKEEPSSKEGSCFWVGGWRHKLCKCLNCKKLYNDEGVSYLIDPLDSVESYEEAGKAKLKESQYEKGMKALSSLNHVQQVNAIEGFNEMKDSLKQYLKKFAETKKVVREEDIKEFFSEMIAQKRRKTEVSTFYQ
ncbi:putative E3 ubiquitin-protein ligase UBR7 [Trichogramma pretiosum]|uniref:putative E3 ubiquitin-protein ligase UBR7 n=1 Tax=Trichogramma pretiosum TaxID=7493 RepID=UPI0006C95DB9|nr:putative E3 ubiquitin-protein ligase UBR7 [Trichogramma pretiosum]